MKQLYEEIEKKVLKGTNIAIKKLIKEKKIKNENLIVSYNGKVISIPARNLEN